MSNRHIYKISLFIISLLPFSLNAAIPSSGLVGSTKGSFSVSPSGSATYDIPIKLPPNVGGVQPSLSLNYDSSAGNGLLGVGWQLSGLSSITRCPTTLERDGFIDGVDFDENDQWCLDGQRLVNISGNEYRTEIDGYSKIINNNSSGFSVFTAQGLKMTYGHTSSSIVYAEGRGSQSEALQYALSKVEDAHGNFYSIEYVNASYADGEHYPKKISMSNGSFVLSSVELEYDDEYRNDVISGYVAGSKYQVTKLLKSIKTSTRREGLVRQYFLEYGLDGSTKFSRLESIQECTTSITNCLPALALSWSNSISGFDEVAENTGINNNGWEYSPKVADVNGDGVSDLIVARQGTWQLLLGGSELSNGYINTGVANTSYKYAKVIKYNDDELDDLLVPLAGKWKVLISTGSGFEQPQDTGIPNTGYQYNPHVIDVNGDGRNDLVLAYGYKWHVRLMTDNGFGADINTNISNAEWTRTYPLNFDGDGRMDLIMARASKWQVLRSTGDGFELINTQESNIGWDNDPHVLDINGDGLSDLLLAYANKWHVRINSGGGFLDPVSTGVDNLGWDDSPFIYDFNSDGMSDLLIPRNGVWKALVSLGSTMELMATTINNIGWDHRPQVMDLNGDGLQDLLLAYSNVWNARLHKGESPGLLTAIEANDEALFHVQYDYLTNSSVYEKDNISSSFSISQVQPASSVVSQITQPDGIGGTNTTSYKYEGLRFDIKNKRSLGFAKTIVENNKTGIRSETTYNQTYPYIGMATSALTELMSTGQDLSKAIYSGFTATETSGTGEDLGELGTSLMTEPLGGETYYPYFTSSIEESFLLNNDLIKVGKKTVEKNVTTEFDSSNEIVKKTSIVSTFGDDGRGTFTTTTVSDYTNNYADRRQGAVTLVTATTTAPGTAPITRESSFAYDWTNGKLAQEMIEPNNTDPSVSRVTNYGYDTFGNRTSTVTCDGSNLYSCTVNSPGARFGSVQFDSDGLFATSSTNALNQTVSSIYDARFGVVTSTTDVNGLTSTSTYDSLGRKESSTNALGMTATMTREWCDLSCPTVGGNLAYYKVTSQAPATPTKVVYFDQHNREIRKQSEGFDGTLIFVDTEYDSYGRVKRTSEPYFNSSNAEIYWNTPSYDGLNRKISVSSPNQDGAYDTTSRISYSGFMTTVTDALDRSVIEVKNVIGKVVKMTDKAQNDTLYEYDALGMLTKTIDSSINEVVLQYDDRGRKKEMNDPDMGTWTYKYNTFDQLVEQIDAKGQKTKMVYDVLGRMTSRIDLAGTGSAATSTWIFDTASGKGKGKLYQKTAANGDYTRYTYNSTFGQLTTTQQKIGSKVFSINTAYDSYGRANQTTYPATTAYSSGFQVKRAYNARGYLERVFKSDNSIDYWTADFMSPRGQLEAATLGNGVEDLAAYSNANGWLVANVSTLGSTTLSDVTYTFDEVGNIKTRLDLLQQNTRETFNYDELDRLTGSSISGGASGVSHTSKSYGYDSLGNITSKSDVGAYSYSGCGNRPHAVCNAGGKSYVYDANGSMVNVMVGTNVETLVDYSAFNKANLMNRNGYSVTFNYDADRRRNYKSVVQGASVTLQNYYVGTNGSGAKLFEQEVSSANGTKDIHYIYGAGGQAIATHIAEGASKRTEYLHRDHLGSVALVTNDAGAAVNDAVSFNAFGKRRNANWTDSSDPSALAPIVGNIGFTGHETISEIGLVHMNGRVYDPNLGRFLSADPIIQAPYNSQSYNRYSYVMNNPLSLIDPSGYSWWSKTAKKIKRAARKIDWKEVGRFALRTVACGPYCAAAYSKPGQKYITSHKWAQQAMSVVAGGADAMGCMGACSAANAAMLTDINGGDFDDVWKSAAMAYVSYLAFSSVNAQYGKAWDVSRVIANGVTGGAVAKAYGGEFKDGAKFSAAVSLLQMGFNKLTLAGEDAGVVPRQGGAEIGDHPFAESAPLITSLNGDQVTLKFSQGLELLDYGQFAFGFADGVGVGSELWFSQQILSSYNVPFLHEISLIHDIGLGFLGHGVVANISTMPVAAGIVVGGYAGLFQSSIYSETYGRRGSVGF